MCRQVGKAHELFRESDRSAVGSMNNNHSTRLLFLSRNMKKNGNNLIDDY